MKQSLALAMAICILTIHMNNFRVNYLQLLSNIQKCKAVVLPNSQQFINEQCLLLMQHHQALIYNSQSSSLKPITFPPKMTFIIADSVTPVIINMKSGLQLDKRICEYRIGLNLILAGLGMQNTDKSLLSLFDL